MKPIAIIYTTDMERAKKFYTGLTPNTAIKTSSPYWTELELSGVSIALHFIDALADGQSGHLGLSFLADKPLEDVIEHLNHEGIDIFQAIQDEPFGRSFLLKDPDGLVIQVNEHA